MKIMFEKGRMGEYYDTNPRLKELLNYRNLQDGQHLGELEEELMSELKKTVKGSFKYKNLQGWLLSVRARRIESRLNQIHKRGNTKELIKDYIFKNGFKSKDIFIKGFERNKRIEESNIRIDLINKDFIFYIYAYNCRARVVSQILAIWQYFLDKENKKYSFIVVAPGFNYQYTLALKAIGSLNINIGNFDFIIKRNKIIFRNID